MKYKEAAEKVSEKLNISTDIVELAYQSFWLFARNHIESLPLKDDLTEEEFHKYQTNINVPSLGKLNCTYKDYLGIKQRYKYLKNRLKNDDIKEN